jgi:enterochelin esterase-like enzyme
LGTGLAGYDSTEKDIVDDLIPFVEKHYRTLPGPKNLAVAGLSMSAGLAANVGLKRLDVFASVGLLSSGMFRGAAGAPPAGAEFQPRAFCVPPRPLTRSSACSFFLLR